LSLRSGHHALSQPSESTHEEEVFERLAEHVAARDAFVLGDLIQLAPDSLRQADSDRLSHDVLDSITRDDADEGHSDSKCTRVPLHGVALNNLQVIAEGEIKAYCTPRTHDAI
jgi:hypothetical protein